MDILPTLEGIPVVFHDLNMKRATGLDADIRQVLRAALRHLIGGRAAKQTGILNGGLHAGWIGCLGEASQLQGVPRTSP